MRSQAGAWERVESAFPYEFEIRSWKFQAPANRLGHESAFLPLRFERGSGRIINCLPFTDRVFRCPVARVIPMSSSILFRARICFAAAVVGLTASGLPAADVHPSQFLPDTTVGYLEITKPAALLANVIDHPISKHIQGMDVYSQAIQTEAYRGYLTGRKFFEIQIGADWRPAIEALTTGGLYAGFDAATQGGVLLVKGKDAATMENFRVKLLEMTRLSGGDAAQPDDYRDVRIYRIQKGGGAVVGEWLVLSNNGDLGKKVLDRLLDADDHAADGEVAGTLSANAQFKAAMATRRADSQAWGFGDLQAVRDAGSAKNVFEDKAENPLAELLIGGIQSTLQKSPYFTLDLSVAKSGMDLNLTTPWQADWVPEERAYFFGPENSGAAPALPEVPDTLLTISTYRNVSDMWLRAGDLFEEQVNDKMAEAEGVLTTIFAGKDFGEEILGALAPEIGIVVTRQNFADVKPVPSIKLPAFAMVLKLKDPETMRAELRRTFQSAIGFFNIIGAQEGGRPQLEMDMQKNGDVDLIISRYVAEKKDYDSTSANIIFNFSPSVGFSGDRFVLSSTAALAKQLAEAPNTRPADATVNTVVALHAPAIGEALADNREQLVSQNMLEEGHSREEAEAAIGLLFELVRCLNGAGLTLERGDGSLSLNLNIDVNENPTR